MSRVIGAAVRALDTVDSTQTVLARLASEGAPEGTVVTARHQTGGRGRRGHAWWDAPGQSLLVSILLRPAMPMTRVPQLSPVAGLAAAEALEGVAGVAARIRWPNDVLVGGRKVCGVVAEAVARAGGGVAHVVLGVGINVDQSEFPEELRDQATSLRLATGVAPDQGRLLAALLDALDRRYRQWLTGGFASLREEWRRRTSTLGERVRAPGGEEGVAVDVAEDGALLVDAGGGGVVRVVAAAGPPER
jgi:BirA family biotin operon repressor/biotin-[acetyl-CoA-carboxylase] ligase